MTTSLYFDFVPKGSYQEFEMEDLLPRAGLGGQTISRRALAGVHGRRLLLHGVRLLGLDPRANLKIVPFIPHPHQVKSSRPWIKQSTTPRGKVGRST